MDAIEFIKERDRMYEVAWYAPSLIYKHEKSAEEIVREVKEWAVAHPIKTRQSVFMEQWPDVYLDGHRVIAMCPCTLSKEYRDIDCGLRDCAECRKEFWMKEVE